MHPVLFLLAQTHAAPDTVLTRIVPAAATGFQQTIAVAASLAVLLAYLLFGAAVWATLKMRRAFDEAKASLDQVGQQLRSLAANANKIADDLATVTDSVRDDVDAIHETVDYANHRARHAIAALADRVDSFNGALEAVQNDTQDVVVSALAALKGVRAGVSAFQGKKPKPPRRPARTPAEPADDAPPDLPARPRLRRRT